MCHLHRQGAGNQFMMSGLVFQFFPLVPVLKQKSRAQEWSVQNHIDLVKGQPVPHQLPVADKQGTAEFQIEADHLPAPPSAVLLD